MRLNNMLLKKREVVGNMYVYTYVNPFGRELKIAKLIPQIKEVVVDGNDNNIILPCVPDKITIKGSNNTIKVEEELEIPGFMIKKQEQRARGFIKRLFNK